MSVPDTSRTFHANQAAALTDLINAHLNAPLDYDEMLMERDCGEWSGLTVAEIAAEYPAEWDAREARVAVGRGRGRDVVIDHAFAVELVPRDPGQTFADIDVGKRVAAALGESCCNGNRSRRACWRTCRCIGCSRLPRHRSR